MAIWPYKNQGQITENPKFHFFDPSNGFLLFLGSHGLFRLGKNHLFHKPFGAMVEKWSFSTTGVKKRNPLKMVICPCKNQGQITENPKFIFLGPLEGFGHFQVFQGCSAKLLRIT